MNQKAATKQNKRMSSRLPVAEPPPELTGAEKLFEQVKPHLATITLAVVAGLLGFIVIAFIMRNRFDQNAMQWRELNNASAIALRTNQVEPLKQVAENNPETKAGLWALQMAGDQQLRMGLEQLNTDRDAGLALIRKSKESFETVVDASASVKTTMLQRRSQFSLAYACESLGEFEEAKILYQELVDQAPDSAFAEPARRAIARCSNEDYAKLYTKFTEFVPVEESPAPGPALPERPSITDFPEVDLPPGQKPPTESTPTEGGTTEKPADKPAADPNAFPTGTDGATGPADPSTPTDKTDDKQPPVESTESKKSDDKSDTDPPKTDGNDK